MSASPTLPTAASRWAPTGTWPNVRKSKAMRDVEAEFGGKDLRDLILDAIASHALDREAADSLGLNPTTMSLWIARLDIVFLAKYARDLRNEPALAS